MRRETRISYPFGPATQLPRRDGTRERRNGLRADARACEGAARGVGVPASDRAGVWGGAPRRSVLCGAKRGFRTRLGQLLSCHGPTAYGSGVNGLRADARACEGAARGVGVPASDRAGVWG